MASPLLQDALTNNVFIAFLTLVYVLVLMEICSFVRDYCKKPELGRKIIHIGAASWLLFWPLFDTSHWSWTLNIAIPFVYFIKLLYLALILRDPKHEDIQNMTRTGDPMELLVGPFQFVVVMMWLGLLEFMTLKAAVIMAALGFGDGIAPLVAGKHKYKVPFSSQKSLEGSMGVFVGTMIGLSLYPPLLGLGFLDVRLVVALGAIATVGEGTAPFNSDNIVVPALIYFSMEPLMERFN